MIDGMSEFVVSSEKPFTFGEDAFFEKFAKLHLQPAYASVPRRVLKRRCMKQYENAKENLKIFFLNLMVVFRLLVIFGLQKWVILTFLALVIG